MNESNQRTCEVCGNTMSYRVEGSTGITFCTKCGWNIASTDLPAIEKDFSAYSVYIDAGDPGNLKQIRMLAEVTGSNFLASKAILGSRGAKLYEGMAVDVARVRDKLLSVGIKTIIVPDFKY